MADGGRPITHWNELSRRRYNVPNGKAGDLTNTIPFYFINSSGQVIKMGLCKSNTTGSLCLGLSLTPPGYSSQTASCNLGGLKIYGVR